MIAPSQTMYIDDPFRVAGFSNNTPSVTIKEAADVSIHFCPGQINTQMFVYDGVKAIIGTDLLRNKQHQLSLITGKDVFRVNQVLINTQSSPKEAKTEFIRRRRMDLTTYLNQQRKYHSTTAWMRATENTIIPPHSFKIVRSYIESSHDITDDHTLLSLFDAALDESTNEIIVPSATYEQTQKFYNLPVENPTDDEYLISKNFVFGEVVNHPSNNKNRDFEIHSLSSVMHQISAPNSLSELPSVASAAAESNKWLRQYM